MDLTSIYVLLCCLVILFFISYNLCGKDFFEPSTMLLMTFIFSTMCAIYKYPTWRYEFSGRTTLLIVSSLFITLIINVLVVSTSLKYSVKMKIKYSEKVSPITFLMKIISLIIILTTMFVLVRYILHVAGIVGTIQSIMASFRNNESYSTDIENQMPQWIKILQYIVNAFSYLYVFDLIYFWKDLNWKKRICDFIIILLCILTGLLSSGRFGMASLLIAICVMYHLIRIKKNGYYKQYKLSTVIKITVIIIFAFFVFYAVRNLVGRDDDQGILGYIGHYFGGGIPLLDIFMKNNSFGAVIWGQETFYSLIGNLRRIGLVDVPYYIRHHEFVYRNGNSMGNVYTAFRDYYHDFGLAGTYILHTCFSLFYSVQYQKNKKKGKLLQIIFFSIIYYSIVFYPFNNTFYASIISVGFLLQLIILFIAYEILLRKKMVYRFNRGKNERK